MIYQVVVYPGVALLGAIVLEHITKVMGWPRPSTGLNKFVPHCINFWKFIGRQIAWFSSFYTILKIDEILESTRDIVIPTWKICTSFVWTVVGYVQYISESIPKGKGWLVVAGSATLCSLSVLCFVASRYYGWRPSSSLIGRGLMRLLGR